MNITFEVPIKTASTSNLREHWAAKHKRVDAQKRATAYRMPRWESGPLLVVTLTRVSTRRLDDDNLRGALKSVRDAVASKLKVDDASPLVRWEYAQETGREPMVRVHIKSETQGEHMKAMYEHEWKVHISAAPDMARALLAFLPKNGHTRECGNSGVNDVLCSTECRDARIALRKDGVLP